MGSAFTDGRRLRGIVGFRVRVGIPDDSTFRFAILCRCGRPVGISLGGRIVREEEGSLRRCIGRFGLRGSGSRCREWRVVRSMIKSVCFNCPLVFKLTDR
jgi:hypothetical protein